MFFSSEKGLGRKLTVVTAGAGCGKSTLLASFVNFSALPFVWYNLDSDDRDPAIFLSYLIKGIQRQFKGFGSKAMDLIKKSHEKKADYKLILATLINEILDAFPQILLVIIEDYHLVEDNKDLRVIINYFLGYLPLNLHVFLSSRRKPDLNLSKLRSQGEIVELKAQDLYFTREETQSLFSKIYRIPLSPHDVKQLEQSTEGWIVGLRLVAEALKGKRPKEKIPSHSLIDSKGLGATSFTK